jgi:hypothetical protein
LLAKTRLRGRAAIADGKEMEWRSIWVSLVVFVGVCMLNRLDISIRHFLIALALIVLLLAPLPRMLSLLKEWYPLTARVGSWLTVALVLASFVTAVRVYPNYIPYFNIFGMGRPAYTLANDSNVDWNQSLPQVESFVRERGLNQVLLDEYGFSEPTAYVPQAVLWDCQQPAAQDEGQWAAVSANYMFDAGNCIWLMHYPHQALAGGSMYAVQLPEVIPAAGQAGGPPLPAGYRHVGGMGDIDPIEMFANCVRDPRQIEVFMAEMRQRAEDARKKK